MFADIFRLATGLVRESYDLVEKTVVATYDDVTSIPDAIAQGWDEGLFSSPSQSTDTDVADATTSADTK